jgi:acyl-CoA synthetase (NDP forming)
MKENAPVNWQHLFSPASIAVIGASNSLGSWGFTIMHGLTPPKNQRIYPVNPKASEVLGVKAYPSITQVPEVVDLAVIVVSAPLVPGVLRECVDRGIKTAMVISAGFGETGEEGRRLETELIEIASLGGLRFVGPNSMGHANNSTQLSTFGIIGEPPQGPVALLSQSGSMTLTIVRHAMEYGIAFSKFISTGNEANIHMEDYLEYLGEDEKTRVITAYIEGLREGRRFFELAKRITRKKPMVVIKIGGTEESAQAVKSHTGALAGSDLIYDAAFRQSGVIRVSDDEELVDVLFALQQGTLPKGNRIGILSLGGGPGAIAAEACEREGLKIGHITASTITKLNELLPPRWSHRNPVDMAGISAAEYPMVAGSLAALMEDENIDAVFLQAPMVATKEQLINRGGLKPEEIKAYRQKEKVNLGLISRKIAESGKPVFLVGRGMRTDPEVAALFNSEKILVVANSLRATRIMRHLTWYRQYLENEDSNQ